MRIGEVPTHLIGSGRPVGHRHSLDATISRRQIIRTAVGASGLLIGARVLQPLLASAAGYDDPKPIPGGIAVAGVGYHVFLPGHPPTDTAGTMINEPSTITDFNGVVGIMDATGTGMGTELTTGSKIPLAFEVDLRFMKGTYIAQDGKARIATFGFV